MSLLRCIILFYLLYVYSSHVADQTGHDLYCFKLLVSPITFQAFKNCHGTDKTSLKLIGKLMSKYKSMAFEFVI